MKLYRIRRKSDGKYFYMFSGAHIESQAIFGPSGTFWKQIDTAINNIRNLCTEEVFDRSHNERKLPLYEVIITDVTVNNETTVSAEKYFARREAA